MSPTTVLVIVGILANPQSAQLRALDGKMKKILHFFRQKMSIMALVFQGISVLCSGAFLAVALLWFFQKPFWFINQSNFEQTTVVLAFIATLTAGFSQYLRSRAQNLQVNSSQVLTSHFPDLWLPINHSKARIDYTKIHDQGQKSDLEEILRKYYKAYTGRFYKIDLVDEISNSLNYRVKGINKKPVLLRIHKKITSEVTLNTLQSIQHHIFESNIFSEPFNHCLQPKTSSLGKKYEQFKGNLIEAYPFAENVMHYSGENLDQIKSVARKYGAVQQTLQQLDPSLDLARFHVRPDLSLLDKELFELILEDSNRAFRDGNVNRFTTLFRQHQAFLEETWQIIEPKLVHIKFHRKPLLHEIHPHNTFFQNNECVLIYDYECVSKDWTKTGALAFAVHRFIREYVRSAKDRGHPGAAKEIPKAVNIFLEYCELGGMAIPPGFTGSLSLEIKLTNFGRVLLVMAYNYRVMKDLANRSEDAWYAELVKFFTYLKEADYFSAS